MSLVKIGKYLAIITKIDAAAISCTRILRSAIPITQISVIQISTMHRYVVPK